MHGPKSVLCTQVLPLDCTQCRNTPPQPSSSSSSNSLLTQIHETNHQPISLRHADTGLSLSPNFSGASTTVESAPESPILERHEPFVSNDTPIDHAKRFQFTGARGDTCASCSLVVPDDLARRLPDGAPGSLRADGKSKNGAPVLRSREMVCLGSGDHTSPNEQAELSLSQNSSEESESGSLRSSGSLFSNCHDHLLTYLSSRNPDDPENFSALRASVIRTLSRELLPAGMSDGGFCFGDTTVGYTIAYVFRLPDPKARGRRRLYALVALAGKDACRAFSACPPVWEAFAKLAKAIEASAVGLQEERKRKEEEENDHPQEADKARSYTPVSSFLAHRATDPDGNPRKAGHVAARSLADMVGSDRIFPDIHSYFVSLLHHLGSLYGGLPSSDAAAVCQTTVEEDKRSAETRTKRSSANFHHTDIFKRAAHEIDEHRDQNSTPRPIAVGPVALKLTASGSSPSTPTATAQHCGPLAISQPSSQQQVVV